MSKKIKKTNAARILDGLGIDYEIKTYAVDENDLSAVHVAEVSGLNIEMIFKTLVARGDKTGIIMAVIGGGDELDLKALARASSNKSVEMIALKELLPLTGYVRGGCSPLGAKKNYPVFVDARAFVAARFNSCRERNRCRINFHRRQSLMMIRSKTSAPARPVFNL